MDIRASAGAVLQPHLAVRADVSTALGSRDQPDCEATAPGSRFPKRWCVTVFACSCPDVRRVANDRIECLVRGRLRTSEDGRRRSCELSPKAIRHDLIAHVPSGVVENQTEGARASCSGILLIIRFKRNEPPGANQSFQVARQRSRPAVSNRRVDYTNKGGTSRTSQERVRASSYPLLIERFDQVG